jgi:hypothetical protein
MAQRFLNFIGPLEDVRFRVYKLGFRVQDLGLRV